MIVVTGGAGFIGSNIVDGLNQRGVRDILVVDNLSDGTKFKNLTGLDFADYMDKQAFIEKIKMGEGLPNITTIFHEGACSSTTEWDGRYMMDNNYSYSKDLLHYCMDNKSAFIYASSAAVYGDSSVFRESMPYERPLNVYGFSKWQFDQYVRNHMGVADSQIVGLRYFNVYGPREQHKGGMASVAFHLNTQLHEGKNPKLFEGCDGYGDGEQQRDFVYVKDVVKQNLWLWEHPEVSGIFNAGTGTAQSFGDVANAVIAFHKTQYQTEASIEYIPFPEKLRNRYQSYTQADMSAIQAVGYDASQAMSVEAGVQDYMQWLNQ